MGALFSVRIETLGCRLNQVESEALAAEFLRCRFSLFDREKNTLHERVGLCIVNTCTVTGKAEQKARRLIRLLLKEHGGAVILVTGCYAELEAEAIEALDGRTHRGRIVRAIASKNSKPVFPLLKRKLRQAGQPARKLCSN